MKKKHWLNPLSLEDWKQLSPREYNAQMEIMQLLDNFKNLKRFLLECKKEHMTNENFVEQVNLLFSLLQGSIDNVIQSYSFVVSEEAETKKQSSGSET